MLLELAIENFAIIERLLLRFESGFTALTGETGAGKSIIIDALQVALGARAAGDVVRSDARTASIEAVFALRQPLDPDLVDVLRESGIEPDDSIIIRREINSSGRGTARINGRAVPLAVLSTVGGFLVDIHGQSEHLSVLRKDRQLEILDRYGDLLALRTKVRDALRAYSGAKRELDSLMAGQREAEQRLDLLRFQVQEIEGAHLQENEEDELASERNLLANAEKLTGLSQRSHDLLEGDDEGALDAVATSAVATRELAAIDPAMAPLADRLEAAQYELDDISAELRAYADRIEFDPQRLAEVEERIDQLSRLKRKYGATLREVIDFGEQAARELSEVERMDERLDLLEREVRESRDRASQLAETLSLRRGHTAEALTEAMKQALQGLALKSTEFAAIVSQVDSPDGLLFPGLGRTVAFSSTGSDSITFLVSFNPGEDMRPLEKVASGGETSRFLLALKTVLAAADAIPTLIFDEVDVGVGGRAGTVVGQHLLDLSREHQVVSITHLPQIAALADHHYSVEKALSHGRTTVTIRELEPADRVVELAQMMSGTDTESARRNAAELLQSAKRAG